MNTPTNTLTEHCIVAGGTDSPPAPRVQISRASKGFTLIELLVVIAIIAILAAILFPVFSRARENARRANCQSNLKQIGLGLIQYSQDYDERVVVWNQAIPGFIAPTGYPSNPAAGEARWPDVLQPYIKSTQVFNCPSATPATYPGAPNTLPKNMHYGYNYRALSFAGCSTNCGVNLNQFTTAGATSFWVGANLASVESAAGTLWVVETNPSAGTDTLRAGPGDGLSVPSSYVTDRHLETLNCLFIDGHVKAMKKSAVLGTGGGQYKLWTTSAD
jgi:prepilin-type N-terminal cleavage/methylation domain-containing protein/prepilin-type processing-associated H-X9-DG protein